jgi:hypothetical protein
MKMQVVGIEISEGVSKKTGNPYSIGKMHALIPIVNAKDSRGYVANIFDCDVHILRGLDKLQLPAHCEIETATVSRYGKAQMQIMSVTPAKA